MKARYWLWESLKLAVGMLTSYAFLVAMMQMSGGMGSFSPMVSWFDAMIAMSTGMAVYSRQVSFVISVGATRKQALWGLYFVRLVNLLVLIVLSGVAAYFFLTFSAPFWTVLLMKVGFILCGMGIGIAMSAVNGDNGGGGTSVFAVLMLSVMMGIVAGVLSLLFELAPVVFAWAVLGIGTLICVLGGIAEAKTIRTHAVR